MAQANSTQRSLSHIPEEPASSAVIDSNVTPAESSQRGRLLGEGLQPQARSPSPLSTSNQSAVTTLTEKSDVEPKAPSIPPDSRAENETATAEATKADAQATVNSVKDDASTNGRTPLSLPTLFAFIALSLSIFLVALDTVIVPTALPTIALSFHIPDSLFVWVGSSYLLANAASVPFWGKLSDIFGRKPIILTAQFVFLSGSILSAVSVSAPMLLAGRAVQGLGGGGVVALVHICVSDLFPIRDRSFYLGTIGAVWAVASALGPVLGGVFAQKLSWRWCFYINLPIVFCSIIVLYFTLHLHNPRTPLLSGLASMDWLGTLTIFAATILLLVGLQLGGIHSYATSYVIAIIVLGSLCYIAFPITQWWEGKRGGGPIMPLRIFKDISNASALGVVACDALVFNSVAYFLPLYFQIVLGRSPAVVGAYMLAIAIPLATISFASGHVIERTGRFLEVLQAGLFFMTLGMGLLTLLNANTHLGMIIGFGIIIGMGFGPNFGAPLIALQTRIREEDIATGVSAFGFVRMVFGAVGVVISQVVFQLLMAPQRDRFLSNGIPDSLAHDLAAGDAISQFHTVAGLPDAQRELVRNAFARALRGTWIFYTVLSALGLIVSFGIKRTTLKRKGKKSSDAEA